MKRNLAFGFVGIFIGILVAAGYAADKFGHSPSAYSVPIMNTNVSRTLNSSGYQISPTQVSMCIYTVNISATLSLTTGQTGSIFLETSPDNATWTEMGRFVNTNSGSLTIGLNLVQSVSGQVKAMVPPGYWVRLRSTGTATNTYTTGEEIIWN